MDENFPVRPEHKLVFHLLESDPDKTRTPSLLKDVVDWEYICRVAEDHSIVPLLYANLKSAPQGLVPKDVLENFQNRYKQIAASNFARSTQLIKLTEQLSGSGVPVIAYKGMSLAAYAYLDTTMRQFGDIDLFIRKADFGKAKELLTQIGCKPAWTLDSRQEKAVLKHYYEYPFYFGETNTLIELHWEWVESFFAFDFEIDGIWDRTVRINLYGKQITTLCAEDYLVILCSHGSKHYWKRLSWICDVAKLIENREIDWDAVRRRASRYGSLRMVWLGIFLAHMLCKTMPPENVWQMICADRNVRRIGEGFIKNVFEDEKEPSKWTEMARIHLKMRESFGTKLKYSYRLFMTKAIDSLFSPMGRPR